MTHIGALNKRIEIQGAILTEDGMGGFSEDWDTLEFQIEVWAAIWSISANETLRSMQMTGEITHRIRIRYPRCEIKPRYRIKYIDAVKGIRYFNITGPPIDPNEKHEWLDILAKEAV